MAKQDVSVSVEKSGMDIIQHVGQIVKAVKAAHASGANLALALPLDITALIAALPPMIADAQAIGAELKEDQLAFIKGCNIGVYDLIEAIKA